MGDLGRWGFSRFRGDQPPERRWYGPLFSGRAGCAERNLSLASVERRERILRSTGPAQVESPKGTGWGGLFLFGTVLPILWALWVIVRIGVANSPLFGSQTEDPTYPRDMAELWATAVILTVSGAAFLAVIMRSTHRRVSTVVFAILTWAAAAANWAILVLP